MSKMDFNQTRQKAVLIFRGFAVLWPEMVNVVNDSQCQIEGRLQAKSDSVKRPRPKLSG
jgi:hypothetical protein